MTQLCFGVTAVALIASIGVTAYAIAAWRSPAGLVAAGGWPLAIGAVFAVILTVLSGQLWVDRQMMFESMYMQPGQTEQGSKGPIRMPDQKA